MNRLKILLIFYGVIQMQGVRAVDDDQRNYIPGHQYNAERQPLGYFARNNIDKNPRFSWRQINTFLQERDDRPQIVGRFRTRYENEKLLDAELLTLQRLRLIIQEMIVRVGLDTTLEFLSMVSHNLLEMSVDVIPQLPPDVLLPYYNQILLTFHESPVQEIDRQVMVWRVLEMEFLGRLNFKK